MVLNGGNNDMMMLVMMMMLREVAYSLTHACVYMYTNCIYCIHHPLCISQCSKLTNFSAGSKKTQTLVKYYVFFQGKITDSIRKHIGASSCQFHLVFIALSAYRIAVQQWQTSAIMYIQKFTMKLKNDKDKFSLSLLRCLQHAIFKDWSPKIKR